MVGTDVSRPGVGLGHVGENDALPTRSRPPRTRYIGPYEICVLFDILNKPIGHRFGEAWIVDIHV